MKKLLLLGALTAHSMFGSFYSIKSVRELEHKMHSKPQGLLCFAPRSHSDCDGIVGLLRYVADRFSMQESPRKELLFLWVDTDAPGLACWASKRYGYCSDPLFVIWSNNEVLATTDLHKHYVSRLLELFLIKTLA